MSISLNRMKESILRLLAHLYPLSLLKSINYCLDVILSYKFATKLNACGNGSRFGHIEFSIGHEHIRVGENTIFHSHLFLTAWGKKNDKSIKISIGDGCSIGAYCHISAFNYISIGNNVLIGKWVSIIDNNHGKTNMAF